MIDVSITYISRKTSFLIDSEFTETVVFSNILSLKAFSLQGYFSLFIPYVELLRFLVVCIWTFLLFLCYVFVSIYSEPLSLDCLLLFAFSAACTCLWRPWWCREARFVLAPFPTAVNLPSPLTCDGHLIPHQDTCAHTRPYRWTCCPVSLVCCSSPGLFHHLVFCVALWFRFMSKTANSFPFPLTS